MEDRAEQDPRLAERVLQGDTQAFGELMGRYQRLVASVAWRYGVPQQEIEDVVSEVFIKTFSNLDRYRPEHAFSTWLYRLATNHVIDHTRRSRREQKRSEMPEQLTDPAPVAETELQRNERSELVRGALNDVKNHYREVLFLVYVEGLKVEEAARVLELPTGTVKTRLMRGRQALRKIL